MKKNIVIVIISTILLLNVNSNDGNNNASALTYGNNVDLKYHVNTTLDVSLSSSDNGNNFNGFVIKDLTPGTAAYSNIVTITASSNNSDGFIMSATVGKDSGVDSYRNNSRLVHSNNTNYFESIATNANISLEELGSNGTTNEWGYAICETIANNECTTWSNYNGLPVVGTAENPTVGTTLAELDTAGSTSVDMKIGASSTNTQVFGTFTNDINFTITAKVVTYDFIITYDGNGSGDAVSNVPADTSGSLQAGQTLFTSNQIPTRTGYDFLGWCDSTITGATCDGRLYSPNEYIKITSPQDNTTGNTNSITLSAVWLRYIQDLTLSICKDKAMLSPYTVYDRRATSSNHNYEEGDEGDYTVRYINGECWMTQNLRIQGVISAEDSNFEGEDFNTSEYSLASTDASYAGHCNAYGRNYSCSKKASNSTIGAWYNYYSASAGTIATDSNAIKATNDICPSGWRLPTGPNLVSGRDYNLLIGNTISGWQDFPLNTIAFQLTDGGGYFDGQLQKEQRGYWWSSNAASGEIRYNLRYDSAYNQLDGSDSSQRYRGYFIRCVRAS